MSHPLRLRDRLIGYAAQPGSTLGLASALFVVLWLAADARGDRTAAERHLTAAVACVAGMWLWRRFEEWLARVRR